MFCNNCGAEIIGNGKFCGKCGTPVANNSTDANFRENAPGNTQAPAYGQPENPAPVNPGPQISEPQNTPPVNKYMGAPGNFNQPVKKEKSTLAKVLPILIPVLILVIGAVIFLVIFLGKGEADDDDDESSTSKKKNKKDTTISTEVDNGQLVEGTYLINASPSDDIVSAGIADDSGRLNDTLWISIEDVEEKLGEGISLTTDGILNFPALKFSGCDIEVKGWGQDPGVYLKITVADYSIDYPRISCEGGYDTIAIHSELPGYFLDFGGNTYVFAGFLNSNDYSRFSDYVAWLNSVMTEESFYFEEPLLLSNGNAIFGSWWVRESDITRMQSRGKMYTADSILNESFVTIHFQPADSYFEIMCDGSGAHIGYESCRISANNTIEVTESESGSIYTFCFDFSDGLTRLVYYGESYLCIYPDASEEYFREVLAETVNAGVVETPDGLAKDFIAESGYFINCLWLCQDEFTNYLYGNTPEDMHVIEFYDDGSFLAGNLFTVHEIWNITGIRITGADSLEIDAVCYGNAETTNTTIDCYFEWSGDRIVMIYCEGDFCMRYCFVSYSDENLINFIYQ